jgi:hypothetical protein
LNTKSLHKPLTKALVLLPHALQAWTDARYLRGWRIQLHFACTLNLLCTASLS